MDDREQFESAMRKLHPGMSEIHFEKNAAGQYVSMVMIGNLKIWNAAIRQAATRDTASADAVDEIVPWRKVMGLAEKHGNGWSESAGWTFFCDDALHAFAQAIAASAPKV